MWNEGQRCIVRRKPIEREEEEEGGAKETNWLALEVDFDMFHILSLEIHIERI